MKKLLFGMAIWASTIVLAGAQTVETAAPPPLIPFSGTITASSGGPFVGLASAIFSLYEEPERGVPVWVDIQMVQTDAAGAYLVLLGAATELPVDLFATNESLWLGVQPEGQAEQPRVRFLSVPYALKARDADTLGGRPLADFVLLGGEYSDGEGGGSAKTAGARATTSSDDLVITNTNEVVGAPLVVNGESHLLGNVGVGTTSPNVVGFGLALTLSQNTAANAVALELRSNSDSIADATSIGRISWGAGTTNKRVVEIGATVSGTSENSAHLLFETMNAGTRAERVRITDTGNVGIGTPIPLELLHIGSGNVLLDNNQRFQVKDTGGTVRNVLYKGGDNKVYIGDSATAHDTVFLGSGNVGIGIGSPLAKLHVDGDLQVDGNLAAKYQDVAEWVEAVGDPTPGTVVVADPLGSNRVKVAEASYDSKVLGAVSLRPGLVLGEPGPNRVLVAQSGRVMVKVDASYGAIAPGDLLSTSPTPGHAMRSDPLILGGLSLHRPGTVLGKALESLRTGLGEILVLITLQ